jgi:hypothetical protein
MLRRFILALNTAKGLQHPDASVRLLSIEFLAPVVTQIVADAKQVRVYTLRSVLHTPQAYLQAKHT